VPAKGELTVRAKADDTDLYGQIIGERGNLPAGIRWDVTSFPVEEQAVVYGENRTPSSGGTTAYRTVLRPEDLDLAKKKLEQELTASARSLVDEEILLRNASEKAATYVLLDYTEFTAQTFSGFVLPLQFLGQPVTSIPVEGQILFTMFAYNAKDIFDLLVHELEAHVREGKQLVEDDVGIDRMVSHVIDYQDDLSWIKLTVDLTGTEQYILDVLSPGGALFAKRVREQVSGLTSDQALRIIRNMPEVEKVTISQWPPWNRTLPRIPSHISIVPES
jgi:hypothetical protein